MLPLFPVVGGQPFVQEERRRLLSERRTLAEALQELMHSQTQTNVATTP